MYNKLYIHGTKILRRHLILACGVLSNIKMFYLTTLTMIRIMQ